VDESIYICWTRGAHLATTKEKSVDMKGNVIFGERLSLLCTMYQSQSGKFQEKMSKLAFKVKKKSKSVSSYKFDLSTYIQGPEFTSEDLYLDFNSDGGMFAKDKPGGKLHVKISSRFLPPDAAGDTFTEMSGGSEMQSTMSLGEDLSDDEEPAKLGSMTTSNATIGEGGGEAKAKVKQLEEVVSSSDVLNKRLQEELKSKEDELSKAKAEIRTLGHANIELQTRKTSLEASLSDRQAEIARIQREKADDTAALQDQIETLQNGAGGGQEDMAFARQLQEQLEKKEQETTSLRDSLAEMQDALHTAEAEQSRLQKELDKEVDSHAATTIERDTLLQEANHGSGGLASASALASADREKNSLLDEKIALQKEVADLKVQLAQSKAGVKQPQLSLEGVDDQVKEHVGYLEMELVTTKINWAQAEEEKDLAWFKVRDVKKQLQKAHETNRQFAKRMTKLEVSLSTEKQKTMSSKAGAPAGNPFD